MVTFWSTVLEAVWVRVVLQGSVEDVLNQVTALSPVEAAAVSASGIVSLGAVRWILKRRAAPTGGANPTATSVSSTASGTTGSTSKSVAFTLPGVLPLSKGIREVTHDEVHAMELGFVVGVVLAWLYGQGYTQPVLGMLVAFVAGSLGFKRYSSKAVKTIRMEPWYALLALAMGGGLGWALFLREPGLLSVLGL